ncbi:hypothetical protein [Absidia glauca]|uniref:Chromo domain-containing protein n=1 Tax=Absidia glauca TaxID=4829 RepID=A0A163J5E1_ABSGL|nr:hypothetical protein [Absidia glauca]
MYVPAAQLSINKKPSKRLDTPPFNIMFGRKLNDFKNYNQENGIQTPLTQEEVNQRIEDLQSIIFPAIQEKTAIAIKQQRSKFDAKKLQRDFPVDSYVRVKVPSKLRSKMDVIYEGPYQVIRKTQAGTYVLKDLEGDKLHRNFTVEELKPVNNEDHDEQNTYEVERILAHRKDPKTNKYEYKVKWRTYDDVHNSWEPEKHFYSNDVIIQYWNDVKGRNHSEGRSSNQQPPKRKNRKNHSEPTRKSKRHNKTQPPKY